MMYMHEGNPQARREPWLQLAAAVAACGTLLLIVFSNTLFTWASQAVLTFF
jgi:hypothetical protein